MQSKKIIAFLKAEKGEKEEEQKKKSLQTLQKPKSFHFFLHPAWSKIIFGIFFSC